MKYPYSNNKQNEYSHFNPSLRDTKAEIICAKEGAIKQAKDGTFRVQSQSKSGFYKVVPVDGWPNYVCECPAFKTDGGPCKHTQAVRFFLIDGPENPHSLPQPPKRPTYPQDWSAYDAAQTQEARLFSKILNMLTSRIPEPIQETGRPRISLAESIFCSALKVYSRKSCRTAKGLYQDAAEAGFIDHAYNFNVPSRTFNNHAVTPILLDLISVSAKPLIGKEVDFAIDSTGFTTTKIGEYNHTKHGIKKQHEWVKLHACAGVKSNIITAVSVTDGYANDSPQFRPLVQATYDAGFSLNEVSADKAYLSRENLEYVARLGGRAFIPFKSNSIRNSKGSKLWNENFDMFEVERVAFNDHYHKRSNVESAFGAIKMKLGETIKSKNLIAQQNELLAKVLAYNICVLIKELFRKKQVKLVKQAEQEMEAIPLVV